MSSEAMREVNITIFTFIPKIHSKNTHLVPIKLISLNLLKRESRTKSSSPRKDLQTPTTTNTGEGPSNL